MRDKGSMNVALSDMVDTVMKLDRENARLREALEWFVNLAHEVSRSGDKPEPSEWEACVEQAGRVLKGGGE